jgi:LPXTG-motif cell wall-anchored protein
MDNLLSLFQREPVLVIALANAALLVAVTFGLPITGEQKTAIDTLLGALLAIGAGVVIRSRVTPVATVVPPPH